MEKVVESSGLRTLSNVAAAIAVLLMLGAVAEATGTKNCTTHCGNISIPYPFGVEPGCYLDGFNLTCRNVGPRRDRSKLFLGDGTVQVLGISLPNGTVRIQSSLIYLPPGAAAGTPAYGAVVRNSTWGGALRASGPYFLSEGGRNTLAVGGCDVQAVLLGENGDAVSTCAAFCPTGEDVWSHAGTGSCSGIGCCQANIIFGRNSYRFQIRQLNGSTARSAPVFLGIVDSDAVFDPLGDSFARALPSVLDWNINYTTCVNASSSACRSNNSVCKNTTAYGHVGGHLCHCSPGYDGNPYIRDGCQDIDECRIPDIYPCYGECMNTVGGYRCRCPTGYEGNSTYSGGCKDINECLQTVNPCLHGTCINMLGTYRCSAKKSIIGLPGLITVIAISAGFGLLFSLLGVAKITNKLKQRRAKKLRQEFFKKNHGLLLQQLFSSNKHIAERTRIFSLEELEQSTNKFDHNRILGGGGHGTVYKGISSDQRVVAIKKAKTIAEKEIDQFINEVVILSQTNHRNVVNLFGCCLETEVPLLVYEFISNGTLSFHLHGQSENQLSWKDRLRIALETARAIAYLHSAASISVFHRDIKCANILLTDTLTAKVSDFGASRSISVDETGISTAVQGTYGYLDPEYYYTGRLTEKSDVYSFGVILAELLTRVKPVFPSHSSEVTGLASHFVSLMRDNRFLDIVDTQIVDEGGVEDAEVVARLAEACLSLKGEERPNMRQVETTLENVQNSKLSSQITRVNHNAINDQAYKGSKGGEGTRLYSLEKEFIQSSEIPR